MKSLSFFWSVQYLWIFLILQFLFTSTHGQTLSVTYSRARLPTLDYDHSLWYNGQDDIYIFGSTYLQQSKTILRYSLHRQHYCGRIPPSFRNRRPSSGRQGWKRFLFWCRKSHLRQSCEICSHHKFLICGGYTATCYLWQSQHQSGKYRPHFWRTSFRGWPWNIRI